LKFSRYIVITFSRYMTIAQRMGWQRVGWLIVYRFGQGCKRFGCRLDIGVDGVLANLAVAQVDVA
jgi:hypothetical protein